MRTAEIIGPRKNVEGAEKKKRDEGRARMIYEDKARVCVYVCGRAETRLCSVCRIKKTTR